MWNGGLKFIMDTFLLFVIDLYVSGKDSEGGTLFCHCRPNMPLYSDLLSNPSITSPFLNWFIKEIERWYCSWVHAQCCMQVMYTHIIWHTMIHDQAWVGSLLYKLLLQTWDGFPPHGSSILMHVWKHSSTFKRIFAKKKKKTAVLDSTCSTYSHIRHGRIT